MLKFFKSQSGKDYFDLKGIEALSRVRAAQSKIYSFAEAFELIRLSIPIVVKKESNNLEVAPEDVKPLMEKRGK